MTLWVIVPRFDPRSASTPGSPTSTTSTRQLTPDTLFPFSETTLAHAARILGTYGVDVEGRGHPGRMTTQDATPAQQGSGISVQA